jgi:cyclase
MDIERDGSLMGYNLELIEAVCSKVSVPVVPVGGCGNWSHMYEGFRAGAHGCATQVIHHFTEPSLRACKTFLKDRGVLVRL